MFQLKILFWYEERMGNPHPFLPLIVVPELLFNYFAYNVISTSDSVVPPFTTLGTTST